MADKPVTVSVNLGERTRAMLTNFLLTSVTIEGESKRRRLQRAFEALDLEPLEVAILADGTKIDSYDDEEQRAFDVPRETIDFLAECINGAKLNGIGARVFGRMLDAMAKG